MSRSIALRTFTVLLLGIAVQAGALAFGATGHRIAGELAQPLLCKRAAEEVAALTDNASLAEIGLWADRVRDDREWRHTGPWHYINVDDGMPIEKFRPPREGDVLWAIQRHVEMLAEPGARARRAQALSFLVHFIVDVHQPLHVGREEDRGGNAIDVEFRGEKSNLHRFWDTDVLRLDGLSVSEYAARIEPLVRMFAGRDHTSPADWAAESFELRPLVYGFRRRGEGPVSLDDAYLEAADFATRVRLAQAAVRLAATLNGLLADPGCSPGK